MDKLGSVETAWRKWQYSVSNIRMHMPSIIETEAVELLAVWHSYGVWISYQATPVPMKVGVMYTAPKQTLQTTFFSTVLEGELPELQDSLLPSLSSLSNHLPIACSRYQPCRTYCQFRSKSSKLQSKPGTWRCRSLDPMTSFCIWRLHLLEADDKYIHPI